MPTNTRESARKSPLRFFLLVFALSIPFWVAGAFAPFPLLPGLPVSALMFVCPGMAALILVNRESGARGMTELLKRAFDFGRIGRNIWYAPMLLLLPAVTALTYGLLRVLGTPLSAPEFPVFRMLDFLTLFFVAALGEELGWSGYITEPLQDRWGALQASLLLGVVCAVWHIIPLLQAQRSAEWIEWWCVYTIAERVMIVWLYNGTGRSVFAAALFHATGNLSWILFPNYDRAWDPRVAGLVAIFAALMTTVVWGPRFFDKNRST